MKERKIVSALECLSVSELTGFRKFLQSPFFNVNQAVLRYYEILERAIRQSENINEVSSDKLWNQVFTDQPFNNQQFLKLNSDLVKLLEEYIAQKEFESSSSLRAFLKVEGVRKHGIENLYNGILAEVERLDNREFNQSSAYYLTRYQIEKSIFSLTSENEKKNEKSTMNRELNIRMISNNMDYFYVAEKLRLYCTLLSWQKMYRLDIRLDHMNFILDCVDKEPYNSLPPIRMYNQIRLTYVEEENTQHYFELKNLIKDYIHLFPQDEQREIYATAISYCINKVNKNVTEFNAETFYNYSDALKNEVFVVENKMDVSNYRNIVLIALRVNEINWTERFIQEYAQYIDEKYRENAVEFSLARLEFYRKNYGKVLEHLNRVNYEDVWYNINAKTLQIAAYYELDEFDALDSLLMAFKMFIRREKSLSQDRKEHYLNLIRFTGALIKVHPSEKQKISKIKEEIQQSKGVVSKPWLLDKVSELLGN
jgi:hypothetical protein